MAKVIPFRGILYNKEKIHDIGKVVAPPYDVISPEAQELLYELHENNVIRLILGKEQDGDDSSENKYKRAARYFNDWLNQGILIRDDTPAFYVYSQVFSVGVCKEIERVGFVGLIKMEDLDGEAVILHEKTLSGPKADRLNLIRECRAHFSQIFSLYSDPDLIINSTLKKEMNGPPLFDVLDNDLTRHRLWRITDPEVLRKIREAMEGKSIYIADGHHRYETYLNFKKEIMRSKPSGLEQEPYNYTLMYFANMDDKGLMIFPTHRVVTLPNSLDPHDVRVKISRYFEIEEVQEKDQMLELLKERGKSGHVFGAYSKGLGGFWLLTLQDDKVLDRMMPGKIEAWKKLDVVILHALLIEEALGIRNKHFISYIREEDNAIRSVDTGSADLALFLNPTKLSQLKEVASAGERMPQKSTYFYPKLLSGLVMNKID